MRMTMVELGAMVDPPMTRAQIRALAWLAGIEPCGKLRTGKPGPPPWLYDSDVIVRAHAMEAARTSKQFTDNDWIAAALLGRGLIHANPEAGELWWPDGTRAERMTRNIYGEVSAGPERVQAHRVIWTAAEGEIPPAMQVNHRNRLRWDNRRANLELTSFGNNVRHAAGKPYLTYHQAVSQLQMLPPPMERKVPEPAADLVRAGGAFILTGN